MIARGLGGGSDPGHDIGCAHPFPDRIEDTV